MDEIIINTGLESLCPIVKITSYDNDSIAATGMIINDSLNFAIELCAQTAAYHQRYLTGFKRHVFLLMVDSFRRHETFVNKEYNVKAAVSSKSSQGCQYTIQVPGENGLRYSGILTIGSIDYNDQFREDKLRDHHREIFRCLTKDSNHV